MNISLYYEEKGSGFPLILLHGNGEDHTYFKNQIEYFSKRFHVFAVDTRGHGKTPRGDGEFSIRRFAEDLHGFFLEHKIEKADILGFSDGGNIALVYALKYPQTIRKLVLNGANLFPRGVKRRYQLPIEVGYFLADRFSKKSEEAKKNAEILSLMVNDPFVDPEELSKLDVPTLVVVGKHDMINEKHTRLIEEKLLNSRLAILGGDHFVAAKRPKEFNRVVGAFLEE